MLAFDRIGTLAALLVLIVQNPAVHAQTVADAHHDDWNWSFSSSQAAQADADLDSGGEIGLTRSAIALSARRQLNPGLGIGASFRYQYDSWDFTHPIAFGGVAPWQDIHRASVGVQLRARLNDTWQLIAAPTLQYAGEDGAKSGDAMSYGAALAFTRNYGPDLSVGLGAAVLHDIDENKVRPYIAVSWKINENWRLGNPESAGPPGLAGFELGYRRNESWDFGAGMGFSEYRFRLDEHGPTAGGVGESRSLPLYGRVTFRPNTLMRFDAYAGMSFNNRVRVEYADGRGAISEDYDDAPMAGIAVTFSP
jgi:uncharacterized protein DUF6268